MTVPMPVVTLPITSVPVDLGRDEARRLAQEELTKPSYDRDRPLTQRVVEWLLERLGELLDQASGALSSSVGVAILVALILTGTAFVLLRGGPLARRAILHDDPVFSDDRQTAASHRRAADEAHGRGDWNVAVVERYRAIVASLEESSYLEARWGRTADEVAREAGVVLPDAAADLARAARLFDAVYYGSHRAVADDDEYLRRVDASAATGRPASTAGLDTIAVQR